MSRKLSIITVTYNSETTVAQTIESVLSQDYDNLEYIIVDGLSTDGTLDIIKSYAGVDDRVTYISEPDNGIYDAMNKGIRMSTGDVVALLNSDDYYEPGALKSVVSCIPNTESFVIYGMARFLRGGVETAVVMNSHNDLPNRMMMHPACFVSRGVYDKYLYDTSYRSAADYDLFLKLYLEKHITFIPVYSVLVNFRLGGMSSSIVSIVETNNVRCKYGYMSKKSCALANFGVKVKRGLLGKT